MPFGKFRNTTPPPPPPAPTSAAVMLLPAHQPRVLVQVQQCRAVSEIQIAEDGRPMPMVIGPGGAPTPARMYAAKVLVAALSHKYPPAHNTTVTRSGVPLDQSMYLTSYCMVRSPQAEFDQASLDTCRHEDVVTELPRLSQNSPPLFQQHGIIRYQEQIRAGIVMLDCDLCDLWPKSNPEYTSMYTDPNPAVAEKLPWNIECVDMFITEVLPRLRAAVPWIDRCACWYTTPNGFRLVYAFTRPIPVTGLGVSLENIVRGMMCEMALAGVAVDTSCGDWPRHMRVPRCQKGTQRTEDGEFFQLSWNGIDPGAQDADDPPEALQAWPPETFPKCTDFQASNFTAHPNWQLISRVLITGRRLGQQAEAVDSDVGAMPTEAEAEALLKVEGTSRSTVAAEIIKKQLKKIAGGQRKFGYRVKVAQELIRLLYEGAPILEEFAKRRGKSGLHCGNYAATQDLCTLLIDEPAATPQMLYALLVGSFLTAMEARLKAGGAGARGQDEVRAEAWRAVASVYPVVRAHAEQRRREDGEEEQRAQQALEAFRWAQAATREVLAVALAEMTGQPLEWATANLTRHLIVTSKLGVSVLQIRDGIVQYSDPSTRKGDWLIAIQTAGHDLINYADEDGASLPEADIIGAYGTVCHDRVKASRLIRGNRVVYRMEAGQLRPTFWLRLPGVAEDLEPVFHAEIEKFLRLIGGPHIEKLLDWLACFTRIDRPLPALYLHGEPDIGKGLFAAGLKELTASKSAAEFGDALGNFQDFFKDTFLLVVDEDTNSSMGTDFQKDVVGVIRRMIGGEFRHLNFKGIKGLELEGEWRLYIAANNAGVLEIRKDLTATDIAAMEGRIFYLNCTEQSQQLREYLGSFGGNLESGRGTEGWPRKIAEHAIWLRQNRTVQMGRRFLIDAPATSWHESLRVTSAGGDIICQAISRLIQESVSPVSSAASILCIHKKKQKVYLRQDKFQEYVTSNYPRFRGNLSSTVTRLCSERERIPWPEGDTQVQYLKKVYCFPVDLKAVMVSLHEKGFPVDYREVFGPEMWEAQAPDLVKRAYADVEPPPPPPPVQVKDPRQTEEAKWVALRRGGTN